MKWTALAIGLAVALVGISRDARGNDRRDKYTQGNGKKSRRHRLRAHKEALLPHLFVGEHAKLVSAAPADALKEKPSARNDLMILQQPPESPPEHLASITSIPHAFEPATAPTLARTLQLHLRYSADLDPSTRNLLAVEAAPEINGIIGKLVRSERDRALRLAKSGHKQEALETLLQLLVDAPANPNTRLWLVHDTEAGGQHARDSVKLTREGTALGECGLVLQASAPQNAFRRNSPPEELRVGMTDAQLEPVVDQAFALLGASRPRGNVSVGLRKLHRTLTEWLSKHAAEQDANEHALAPLAGRLQTLIAHFEQDHAKATLAPKPAKKTSKKTVVRRRHRYDLPVSALDLEPGVINKLHRSSVVFLGQLATLTRTELLDAAFEGVGPKTVLTIERALTTAPGGKSLALGRKTKWSTPTSANVQTWKDLSWLKLNEKQRSKLESEGVKTVGDVLSRGAETLKSCGLQPQQLSWIHAVRIGLEP